LLQAILYTGFCTHQQYQAGIIFQHILGKTRASLTAAQVVFESMFEGKDGRRLQEVSKG
jgi:hypothetical protein